MNLLVFALVFSGERLVAHQTLERTLASVKQLVTMDMLKKKGIKLLPSTKQAKPKQLENPYGGDFYGF